MADLIKQSVSLPLHMECMVGFEVLSQFGQSNWLTMTTVNGATDGPLQTAGWRLTEY